jgi:hypothetical protein
MHMTERIVLTWIITVYINCFIYIYHKYLF